VDYFQCAEIQDVSASPPSSVVMQRPSRQRNQRCRREARNGENGIRAGAPTSLRPNFRLGRRNDYGYPAARDPRSRHSLDQHSVFFRTARQRIRNYDLSPQPPHDHRQSEGCREGTGLRVCRRRLYLACWHLRDLLDPSTASRSLILFWVSSKCHVSQVHPVFAIPPQSRPGIGQ
jgi:hypothetical protein